jgi:aminopeptidase N
MAGQAEAKPSRKAGQASSWKALAYRIEGRLDTLVPLVYENGQRALPWQGRVEAVLEAPKSEGIPVVMDLEGLWDVDAVHCNGIKVDFVYRNGQIRFDIPRGQASANAQCTVRVDYRGRMLEALKPPWQAGLVATEDSLGYPWLGMTCQGIGARSWWPCLDDAVVEPERVRLQITYPAYAKGTSDSLALMDLVSNGHRVSDTILGKQRCVAWEVITPINLYNVTFNIGRYVRFVHPYRDILGVDRELEFYVSPEDSAKARSHTVQAVDMMACYEKSLGSYPFWSDGYKVVQTSYLGMEHQSAVAYGNGFRNNEWGFDFILVHESGHEWWGNSVSASDPADWWIHEGLTTLMEAVYLECRDGGRRESDAYMQRMQRKIQNRKPMQGPRGRRFAAHDADIYYKGAWMFYSLRNSVGMEEGWNEALRSAYRKFAGRTLGSEQMIEHWANALDPRFAGTLQWWLQHAEVPSLEWSLLDDAEDSTRLMLRYRWAPSAKGFYLPMMTSSGQHMDPVPSRWQTMAWKAGPEALNKDDRQSALQAELANLTQRYLIQVRSLAKTSY